MVRSYYFFGRNRIFLPKLAGAFLLVAALFMFIVASGKMFDTWDALKKYPDCIEQKDISIGSFAQMQYCKQSLADVTGLHLAHDSAKISTRQFVVTLLPPVAELLFWATVFIIGLIFYQTGIVKQAARQALPVKHKGKHEKK